jgi:hypothetical protein
MYHPRLRSNKCLHKDNDVSLSQTFAYIVFLVGRGKYDIFLNISNRVKNSGLEANDNLPFPFCLVDTTLVIFSIFC